MMNVDRIFDFIKEKSEDIFAFIENNRHIPSFNEYEINYNNDNIFTKLILCLIENIPICHHIPINLSHREYDKLRYELERP